MRFKSGLMTGLVIVLYASALYALYARHPVSASDFNVYYRGATRLAQQVPLYADLQSNDYVGPSLIIQPLVPLVRTFDYPTVRTIWLTISLAAAFATTFLITDLFSTSRGKLTVWLLMVLLFPGFLGLWIGQFSVVLNFLLVLAWWLYHRNEAGGRGIRVTAGILIGITIFTKFFPALLVFYFAWKRDWWVVLGALIGSIASILFQIAGTSIAIFVDYYTRVLPSLALEGQPLFAAANQSVLGFAQKTFLAVRNGIPLVESEALMNLTRFGVSALLGMTLVYLTFSRKPAPVSPVRRFDLEYSLVLTVALLLGSTLGYYGIQGALLPLAVIWKESEHRIPRIYTGLWFAAALLLIDFYLLLTLGIFQMGSETQASWTILSAPFFGMMIVWGWLVYLLYRLRRTGTNTGRT